MKFANGHYLLVSTILQLLNIVFSSPVTFRNIATIKRSGSEINEIYDYLIIGGGTSGLTVADRLTQDGTKTVLVVEYGPLDNNDHTIIYPPINLHINSDFIFNLTAIPQPGLAGRTPSVVAGKVVGGGSAVNGMFFDRGSAEDYDNWAKLGNPGWGFDELLPYFRKSSTFTPPTKEIEEGWNVTYDADAYGDGPIQATFPPFLYQGLKSVWNAWLDFGIKNSLRPASGDALGIIWAPSSENPVSRERSFARTGYYDRDKTRSNYHFLTGHKVLNISISDTGRAEGITFQPLKDTDSITNVRAKREVVLAAGALHSPQILQRSGVGPKALLEKAGISVKYDLPGVGQNFQDHGYGAMPYSYQTPLVPNPAMLQNDPAFLADAQALWDANRTGPLTFVANTGAFLPLKTVTDNWQAIINTAQSQDASRYLPAQYTGPVLAGYKAQKAILLDSYASTRSATMETPIRITPTVSFVLLKPLSRGSVNLNPDDPYGEPLVDFQSLANPVDVKILTEEFRFLRKWLTASLNQQLGAAEGNATVNLKTDSEIEQMLRNGVTASISHPSGTNSMMPEALGGVVGPDLLVHGVSGLSVVDSSIMPLIPGTHLSATVYAVAEKAADLIKGRAESYLKHSGPTGP